MKYTLAVLALLSYVSAEQIKQTAPHIDDDGYIVMKQQIGRSKSHKIRSQDKPSNEVCDGDSAEDKQLEHEGDQNDDIVEDTGFSGSRGHTIRAQVGRKSLAQRQHHKKEKPSNEVCDGDSAEDKQLEHEGDQNDDIVEDTGFSGSRGHTIRAQVGRRALVQRKHHKKEKPSNEVCDGDSAEDKQLEHEGDQNDDIVEDTGFSGSRGHTIRAQVGRKSLAQRKHHKKDKPSNEVCDGDSAEDKQLEHEGDGNDDIVEDWGFNGKRAHTHLQTNSELNSMSNAQLNAMLNARAQYAFNKESDGTCDGDSADNKEISDTADPEDTVVEDFGFSGSRNARGQVRLAQALAQADPPVYKDYFDKHDKYSDSIANGDRDDDKEVQKEMDPHDDIVEDWGFRGTRAHTHLQTGSQVNSMSNAQLNAMLNARAQYAFNKESDGTCDGDSADNKEISDTADPEDTVVEDFGFSGSRNARGQVRLLQTGYSADKYSDEIANGDRDDDKELKQEEDMKDLAADENGHTNAGYGHTPYNKVSEPYKFDLAHYQNNNIKNLFSDHFGTIPRDDSFTQISPEEQEYTAHKTGKDWELIQTMAQKKESYDAPAAPESSSLLQVEESFEEYPINEEHMNVLYTVTKYSDELANGDSADNKELQWEHDPNDPIVDYNGHDNRGYGHTRYDDPENHWAFDNAHYANNNVKNLFSEHFGTVPRGDNPIGGHEE